MKQKDAKMPENSKHYHLEYNRLKTFEKNWVFKGTGLCTPKNFAAAGFYNCSTRKTQNCVRCFACQKELDGWESGDDPWQEHQKRGSDCIFVQFKLKNPDNVSSLVDGIQLFLDLSKGEVRRCSEAARQELVEEFNNILKNLKKKRVGDFHFTPKQF